MKTHGSNSVKASHQVDILFLWEILSFSSDVVPFTNENNGGNMWKYIHLGLEQQPPSRAPQQLEIHRSTQPDSNIAVETMDHLTFVDLAISNDDSVIQFYDLPIF